MILGTWNVNNRVGKMRFRPEAAHAVAAIGADVMVLTEFCPLAQEVAFRQVLADFGLKHQLMSPVQAELTNRVLIASKLPLEPLALVGPDFDLQFPANVLGGFLPDVGLTVLGVRVPAYQGKEAQLLLKAWDWLEQTVQTLGDRPAILLGDLNVTTRSPRSKAGDHFRRMTSGLWRRAEHTCGATFFGHLGRQTEIDHILATAHCQLDTPQVLLRAGDHLLAGEKGALSDHAAVICGVTIP